MNELIYFIHNFFIDCRSLFLRHVNSGKCITNSGVLVYNSPSHAKPYYVVMTDNCLDVNAQFYYYKNTETLRNTNTGGTFAATTSSAYNNRLFVYVPISTYAIGYVKRLEHSLKLSADGSLYFYRKSECGEPLSNNYVNRVTSSCGTPNQKFTFGKLYNYVCHLVGIT
jgi:hypothetical protein